MASEPFVIAHRGASGERPEHTVAAYERAVEQGAHFIEQDLVPTKDGHLIVRHENELSDTTDIADRIAFLSYKRTKVVDGKTITGWFAEDLTLEQIKTLRTRERIGQLRPESVKYNGKFEVLTFAEVLRFARELSAKYKRPIGVYSELKHPTYFRSIGLATEEKLLQALQTAGYNLQKPDENRAVFIQCFEFEPLRILRKQTSLPLVFLAERTGVPADGPSRKDTRTYPDYLTPRGLNELKQTVNGIGPDKNWVIGRDKNGNLERPTSLVADAHRAGLLVHPYTFRSENYFLPTDLQRKPANPNATPEEVARVKGDFAREYQAFFEAGVDGVFSDFPGDAMTARTAFFKGRKAG